ncbi:MAG: B12-binding domain-containing radical SAM protein [Armatimonadota bacterium]
MPHGSVTLVNTNDMKPVVAPLALDYLGACLREAGWAVDVLDLAFAEDVEEAIASHFAARGPLAVAVTLRNTDDCYFASQASCLPRARDMLARLKAHTDAPLILGGCGFSLMPEAIMAYCGVRYAVQGEGEAALPRLLEAIERGEGVDDIPGVVHRRGDELVSTPAEAPALDGLPLARRDTIDNERYFLEGGMAGFETTRGCNRRCVYCADPVIKGGAVRLREPTSVADELECLVGQGVTHFHTCDSEFNVHYRHAVEVCKEIAARGLGEKIQWYAYAIPRPFTHELAGSMKRAGCAGINFGADSGSARMLAALGRDFGPDDLRRTAKICRRHDMVFMYDLLLGAPGETRESVRESIELIREVSPARVGVAAGVRVYPGTQLAATVAQTGDAAGPGLHGVTRENHALAFPLFYVEPALGPEIYDYLAELVGDDERFFLPGGRAAERDYDYSDNELLVRAIADGERGAFWDILRRLAEAGRA